MGKIYTFAFVFLATFAFSQQTNTISIDDRLYDVYDQEYLENVKQNNPFLIQYWNYYLDHAWSIEPLPAEKQSSVQQTIEIPEVEKINILLLEKTLDIHPDRQTYKMYRIKDTGKMLVYLPGKVFVANLNKHLGRTYTN